MASIDEQLANLNASITRVVDDATRIVVLEVAANIREAMPVDTGHARANVLPFVGQPPAGPGGAPAQSAGEAAIAGYTASQGAAGISIPVPYVARLNEGSSTQAPAKFIEQGIGQAITDTERILSERAKGGVR